MPEQLGGERNWDYRYCWLRDATFTLLALMNAGYFEEAHAWRDWLLRAVAGSPDQVQIMYGIRGERNLTGVGNALAGGYENSKPVRIGNAASNSFNWMCTAKSPTRCCTLIWAAFRQRESIGRCTGRLTDHLATIWEQPDEGIWEVRGEPQHFTYSKVMAWVAFDRAIKAIRALRSRRNHGALAKASRPDSRATFARKPTTPQLGSFTQAYGSTNWMPRCC